MTVTNVRVGRWPVQTVENRFWSKVAVGNASECWLWTAARLPRGYGQFQLSGKSRRAHRVAYEIAVGPIPKGMHVLHSCDVTSCVNPAHLHLGTHDENMREMVERKRSASGGHTRRKLTQQDARDIRASSKTPMELARERGVSWSCIKMILRGRTYREGVGAREDSAQAEPNQPAGREQVA